MMVKTKVLLELSKMLKTEAKEDLVYVVKLEVVKKYINGDMELNIDIEQDPSYP